MVLDFLGRCKQVLYCDMLPSDSLMESFKKRGDKQITSLEIVSIALGISSFAHLIRGRRLVIWSDNKGAECATRKGALPCVGSAACIVLVFALCRCSQGVRPKCHYTCNLEKIG